MNHLLRNLVFHLLVKPFTLLAIGLNARHREKLPVHGPAILVANHNSHLDTVVLMSLFTADSLPMLRPVAASDYFMEKNRLLAWFSREIAGIIPLKRVRMQPRPGEAPDPLFPVKEALKQGAIVIYYPEGTRGEAERQARFKTGIARIVSQMPEVPVYPVFLHGLGKSLPKGEGIFVPFICDVVIGDAIRWNDADPKEPNPKAFVAELEARILRLSQEVHRPEWE
jgi:1-acyl-sn-glycerol-3-phosphate acyltransferase